MNLYKLSLLFFVFVNLISCKQEQEMFFMRYKSPDPGKLEKEINRKYAAMKESKTEYDSFNVAVELAENLTIAEREYEAVDILNPYIKTAPAKATKEDLAWLFLNFATANQYCGKTSMANNYFKKAIEVAEVHNFDNIKHYIYHHYGRFLVEKNDYALAKKYFEDALVIRNKLKNKHSGSTQKAIDTLNLIMKKIN